MTAGCFGGIGVIVVLVDGGVVAVEGGVRVIGCCIGVPGTEEVIGGMPDDVIPVGLPVVGAVLDNPGVVAGAKRFPGAEESMILPPLV